MDGMFFKSALRMKQWEAEGSYRIKNKYSICSVLFLNGMIY